MNRSVFFAFDFSDNPAGYLGQFFLACKESQCWLTYYLHETRMAVHSGQYQCVAVLKCFEEEILSGVFDVTGGGKRVIININFSSQFKYSAGSLSREGEYPHSVFIVLPQSLLAFSKMVNCLSHI